MAMNEKRLDLAGGRVLLDQPGRVKCLLGINPYEFFKDDIHVPVRIGYGAKTLREKSKAAQGKWDPKTRAWYIRFGKIKDTELEKFIIS